MGNFWVIILFVKSAETPFLADLFAISFRWLILFGLVTSLSIANRMDWKLLAALGLAALWNFLVTTLASFNRRMTHHRFWNVLADILGSLLIFTIAGGTTGPVVWVGILSITSASIYFEVRGAVLIALITTALQAGTAYASGGPAALSAEMACLLTGINLGAAILAGVLSRPLLKGLRINYEAIVRQRQQGELHAQRAERERMKALFQITETMSSTLNYQTVLETALDGSVTAAGATPEEAQSLLSAFFLFVDGKLHMLSGRGFPAHDLNTPLPASAGVLKEVLQNGNPKLLTGPCQDAELCKLIAFQVTQAIYILPMIRGLNAFGILLFAHPNPEFFNQDRCDILEMVSNQAVIAIQNSRLFQDLNLEKQRIMNSQEEAQKKLARELHDGPTQAVAAIAMRLSIARKMLERDPMEAEEEILRVEDLARRTTQEIRHMLFTLRPLVLETDGLAAALETMAEKMKDLYQQKVSVKIDPDVVDKLDPSTQTVIFNLSEEATNNARKHAQASEVWVRLRYVPNQNKVALLEVIDNGVGFDVKEVMGSYEKRGSLGMIHLREQSEQINGLFKIDSAPGKGTRIRVYIPLTQDAVNQIHHVRLQPGAAD